MQARNKIRACRILMLAILSFLLVSVRALEGILFYDPFTAYFSSDYLMGPFPEYDGIRLFRGILFRYFLNAIFSIGIIYVIFQDRKLLRFTSILYAALFLLLSALFFALLNFSGSENNFIIFYVRRFLIQPLFLILFVPAFYYQSRVAKK